MITPLILDGTNAILGRLASYVAKQALLGKEVSIVNCEKIVISGNKKVILKRYRDIRAKGGSSQKGPYFPTQSAKIMKRTIRGMLSHKEGRGASALKRIKCYEGLPKEFVESKKEQAFQTKGMRTMNLAEVSGELR
ncbi:MAG: 50S ribosomal protein L13 [Nanoarchaeota archaeon]